ncbi:MAG: hypothetical protein FWG06_03215, partial [Clostridiales bacterium]|nr:hypothetical protein [Clostridiales bacterium]
VAGTVIAIPIYTITTNMRPAYIEDYQIGMGDQEGRGTPANESDSIAPGATDSKESEVQELTAAQPSAEAPEKPILNAELQEDPVAKQPIAEPSATEVSVAEPLITEPPGTEMSGTEPSVAEPPITEAPVTEPLIAELPETEMTDTEPLIAKPPVIEPPVAKAPDLEQPIISGNQYTIADYYGEDGGFSALGLALEENNSEKQLTVKAGDLLIVGDRLYIVVANSLTLSFYTQSSLNHAIKWWTDYLNSWAESGKVTER